MSTQILPIAFGSLNEGDDPKALPPGTMLVAENCAMDKSRRIVKRYGTSSLVKTLLAGGSVAAGKRFLLRDEDVTIDDGTEAQSYIEPVAAWKPLSRPPVWSVTKRTIADSTYSVQMLDSAVSGDFLISAYTTFGPGGLVAGVVYYQIENLETGAQILPPTYVTSPISLGSNGVRVLANATHAYVVGSTATDYVAIKISLTTLAVVSTTTLVSGTGIGGPFDACLGTTSAGDSLYLAYEASAGANRTIVASFLLSTMAAGVSTAFSGTGVNVIDIVASATNVYLAYSTSAPVTNIVSMDEDLVALAGPTSLGAFAAHSVFVGNIDANSYLVGYARSDSTGASLSANRLITAQYASATNVLQAATTRQTWGVYRTNKPWKTDGRWYVAVTALTIPYVAASTASFPQASVVVVEIELTSTLTGIQGSTHPLAAVLENQTGWYPASLVVSSPGIDDDGNVWMPVAVRSREPTTRGEFVPVSWNICRLTTSGPDLHRAASVGGGSLLAGGVPLWDDGASMHPYGFLQAPLILSATATAGGSMVAGVYSYVAVFVWRDFNGVLHRSVPSPPLSGTTAGGNLSLTLVISTSCLATKRTTTAAEPPPVFIEIYRTTIGGTSSHYRLSFEPGYNYLFNLTTAGDVTFVDTRADASITGSAPAITLASRAQLYTDTGELADVPPPAFVTVHMHRGRLVGLGPDLRTAWFSKDSTQDATVAPGFNEALTRVFASDKSAFASLDEKLVVFGEKTIDIVHGDGPDATGANDTWQVQGVQTDVGCVNPRSVVTSPEGVMFETVRGIELLSRGLEITWPGEAVTDTLAAYPVITSAVLVPTESEVRFTCNTEEGDEGIVLAWSYLHKTWFTRKYNDESAESSSVAFVDAALIDGVYTMLTAGGRVHREDTTTKLDDGTLWVGRDIVLAPISPGGNCAWHRIKDLSLLGTSVTNHDLEVSFARNYATSYEQTTTYVAGSAVTAIGPLEKCRIGLDNQKCQAVKIRIRDLTPTDPGTYPLGTGDGPILEALALRVSVRPGVAKTAASQQG